MNETQLKEKFSDYSFEAWKNILNYVFDKVEYFSTPNNPFSENKKVITGRQYGRIKLSDGKALALFEVEVDDGINIERNRQGLREIAAKHIDQNITHGALVFYHSNKQDVYRFTFIAKWSELDGETGALVKNETQKKRYTYLLGKNQSGATAAKRLLELASKKPGISIDDVIRTFSVEPVKKEFFKRYKEHYERFWRYIDEKQAYQKLLIDKQKEKEDDKKKPIRDFSKKLLGRIVFLHFLQKKGWMGCPVLATKKDNDEIWLGGDAQFLSNLFDGYKDKSHFYSKCLTELFFGTLNDAKRKNNVFSISGTRVPYLNGGLFDNDQPNTDSIDFPQEYFKELFDFFSQYNFTIDENSADEQEIGIDPEMLGHIFENLLEENREKGAFYTPKEIVNYMCRESLVQYLNNHFPEEAEVEAFIMKQEVSAYFKKKANAVMLDEKLDAVKVCDPAIGSGAFPIGMLQEIYLAKRFIYPYLNNIELFDPAATKKKIIQDSIYGVDIEHGAVEIARLRFWLSLVVDENKPEPLPNLDYKIMQGNSLLESFEGIDLSKVGAAKKDVKIVEPERDLFGNIKDEQLKLTFTQSQTVEEIQKLIKKYFAENDPDKKASYKKQINEKVHYHIDYNLELRETQLERRIAEANAGSNRLNAKDKKKLEALELELVGFKKKRKRLHDIQNTEEKPYFLWHLLFKDVFDSGGFDIVIGNPPYIQLQKLGKEADILEEGGFKTFTRTGDIYCLFYEKGNDILKPHGTLTYITSNKWMIAAYGKNFRKYLLEKTNPTLLIDFSDAVIFPSAVVFVNILSFKREAFAQKIWTVKAEKDFDINQQELSAYVSEKGMLVKEQNEDNWAVVDKADYDIKVQIERIGTPLKEWDINFFRGITSGFNEAFHIDEITKQDLEKKDKNSAEIIKPLLRGKDIKRWNYHFQHLYLINSHNGIREYGIPRINVEKDYKAIYRYLLQFYDENSPLAILLANGTYQTLKDRADQGDHWTNLRNCAFLLEFEKPKIVWIEISDRANFCIDTKNHFLTNSAYFITGDNLNYLLSVLNSRIIDFYHFQNTAQIAGGRKRYTKQYVELFPIPQISNKEMTPFEKLADYLTYLNDVTKLPVNPYTENENIAQVFEDALNMMVYELYFEQHMKELDIDVLQFVTEKTLPWLTKDDKKDADIIGRVYKWLQERENPIRNRIISANIKSNYIRRINSTIH